MEKNTASLAEKIGYRFDLSRMAGSPREAAKLTFAGINIEFQKWWYALLNPMEPEISGDQLRGVSWIERGYPVAPDYFVGSAQGKA